MRVREIIARYSKLPDAILNAQCRTMGKTPQELGAPDLPLLAERVGNAVGMFTNPAKGREARQAIEALGQ